MSYNNDKLPLEFPIREIIAIYLTRLKVFLLTCGIMLVLLTEYIHASESSISRTIGMLFIWYLALLLYKGRTEILEHLIVSDTFFDSMFYFHQSFKLIELITLKPIFLIISYIVGHTSLGRNAKKLKRKKTKL